MTIQLDQRLLTVKEYHQMAEVGILGADDRVELLNGQLINMSPSGSKHAACVEKITEMLRHLLKGQAMVRSQNPIELDLYSEPEPDVAIVRMKENYYADRHPVSQEIFFLIEVSDSSLEKDRQVKLEIYAQAKIPEYWIVNLAKQEVEVYTKPVEGRYHIRQIYTLGDDIPVTFFNNQLSVRSLIV